MSSTPPQPAEIVISLSRQQLSLQVAGCSPQIFAISTARNGAGEQSGSGCTPRGRHHIRIKVGEGAAVNTVFVGRRPTGEIYNEALGRRFPERDWILSRILWLSGDEPGFNRGGEVDTLRRMIYIHGTPQTEPVGVACSHGCIRMHNQDLITLFDQVATGTAVLIKE